MGSIIPWLASISGVLNNLFLLKNPHSPWFGSVSTFVRFLGSSTGFGRGVCDIPTAYFRPVRRRAETPRLGLPSRVLRVQGWGVVVNGDVWHFARAGARKMGGERKRGRRVEGALESSDILM